MISMEDIPEQKWEIAATIIPLVYDIAFMEVLEEKYDDIKRPLYIKAGKEFKNLASALGLQVGNYFHFYKSRLR